ncbi:GTPase Era [Spiroplasma endosymbiont of Labia minor]|uniref:GTPase Era n=1 Tax=Spiroplasma endosymbiont of Labia minor TaxID=3066305 RepID=UPI0030D4C703
MEKIKSGFIAIIGRPNVGKSTLLNQLLQKKISIVTQKAQTTRNKILGILSNDDYQMIFMDTPGIHTPFTNLGSYMNKIAYSSISSADIILFVVPANENIGKNDLAIVEKLKKINKPIILVISKIDVVSLEKLETKKQQWLDLNMNVKDIVVISALENYNLPMLKNVIYKNLPVENNGIKFYPDDMLTDQPEKFLIKEIVREQILLLTEDEVPFSTAVLVEEFEETSKEMKIRVSIIVERNSQKAILIGKHGSMIREIGIKSRMEMERLFNTKVHLNTFVTFEPKWRQSPSLIKKLGYGKDSY